MANPAPVQPNLSSDEDLMLAYCAGQGAAFDTLYARYQAPLYRYVLRTVQTPQVAGDIFQDTWLRLIQAANQWDTARRVAPWLYTVARNRALDHLRSLKQQVFESNGEDAALTEDGLAQAWQLDAAAVVQNQALSQALLLSVARLPDLQREVFVLQAESGLSLADIAGLMQCGVETVKSRLRYAKNTLRADLIEGGWHV